MILIMGTTIRSELSSKNEYWIEKHRYYELRHFCLQYPIWKKACSEIDGLSKRSTYSDILLNTNKISDPTAVCAEARIYYSKRMEMLDNAAIATDTTLHAYILKGVTEGVSYNYLKSILGIPCCKDVYYNLYRRFFWLLDKARN